MKKEFCRKLVDFYKSERTVIQSEYGKYKQRGELVIPERKIWGRI